ncbi:MAG TPA: hypothetical protein VHZ74_13860 [Bryobacteraceae bacterium]|nr:hypothetical protein [Bryobacteraceae bacterium]
MAKRLRQDKKPSFASFVEASKKAPRLASDPSSYYDAHPAWRVIRMEFCDPYGWHQVDAETLLFIREKLGELEKLTWKEVLKPGSGSHPMPTKELCKEARDRLVELEIDEADNLVSIRLQQKMRVWGYMDQGILNLLWWDPEHSVYPMNIANN